jgi:hypothetical protein
MTLTEHALSHVEERKDARIKSAGSPVPSLILIAG